MAYTTPLIPPAVPTGADLELSNDARIHLESLVDRFRALTNGIEDTAYVAQVSLEFVEAVETFLDSSDTCGGS